IPREVFARTVLLFFLRRRIIGVFVYPINRPPLHNITAKLYKGIHLCFGYSFFGERLSSICRNIIRIATLKAYLNLILVFISQQSAALPFFLTSTVHGTVFSDEIMICYA